MLRFVFSDVKGNELILPGPLSAVIRMEEDVPADDIQAVFPFVSGDELKSVRVFDGGKLVFIGDIDEEEHIFSASGEYLRITARSLASRLLDNEAEPCEYDHPSAKTIFERHAERYGIAYSDTDDPTYFGELIIPKGTSQWGALSSFCNACYSRPPRVSADGRLYMKGAEDGEKAVFGDGGIAYTSLTETVKRCEEISRVRIKIDPAGGYERDKDNPDALERGIIRERYINSTLLSTPIKCADVMIDKGRSKAFVITLECPSRLLDILGKDAELRNADIGDRNDLYVSAIKYKVDSKGEITRVKLKRRFG